MSAPALSRDRFSRALSLLLGDTRGVTAIEFGLVALPFLALLGAIVQIAFMTWAQQNLDYTFTKAARTILTGQFQSQNNQQATDATLLTAIHNLMCGPSSSNTLTVYNCAGVKIDIKLGTNFATSTFSPPVDPSTRNWSSGFGTNYTCPGPGNIMIATAAVEFPLFFRLWNAGLASFADGGTLLQSTIVFRVEPYATPGASPC